MNRRNSSDLRSTRTRSSPSETMDKCLEEIRRLRGWGKSSQLDAHLGREPGYVARLLRKEIRLTLEELLRILDFFKVDLGYFVKSALSFNPKSCLEEISKDSYQEVQKVKRIFSRAAARSKDTSKYLDHSAEMSRSELVRKIVSGDGEVADYSRLSEIYRLDYQYSAAAWCLAQGLEEARDFRAKALILRHGAYLSRDACRFLEAFLFSQEARVIYVKNFDLENAALTYIDSGIMLYRCGNARQSIASYTAGLKILDESEWRYKFSALQGLGLAYASLGDCVRAEKFLRLASSALEGNAGNVSHRVGLLWLEGEIAIADGRQGDAAGFFEKLFDYFFEKDMYLDATAIALRLSQIYAALQDLGELKALVRKISPLAKRSNHPLVTSVTQEMSCCILRGKMQMKRLEFFFDKLRRMNTDCM